MVGEKLLMIEHPSQSITFLKNLSEPRSAADADARGEIYFIEGSLQGFTLEVNHRRKTGKLHRFTNFNLRFHDGKPLFLSFFVHFNMSYSN